MLAENSCLTVPSADNFSIHFFESKTRLSCATIPIPGQTLVLDILRASTIKSRYGQAISLGKIFQTKRNIKRDKRTIEIIHFP